MTKKCLEDEQSNLEKQREYVRIWRKKNPEKIKKLRKQYYVDNKEKELTRTRNWVKNNLERRKEITSNWYKNNPIKVRAIKQRKRAAKANVNINDFVSKEWQQLLIIYNNQCVYCGRKIKLTQDHLVPLSRGGDHTITNIVPACGSCNSKKKDKTALEYILFLLK